MEYTIHLVFEAVFKELLKFSRYRSTYTLRIGDLSLHRTYVYFNFKDVKCNYLSLFHSCDFLITGKQFGICNFGSHFLSFLFQIIKEHTKRAYIKIYLQNEQKLQYLQFCSKKLIWLNSFKNDLY